MDPPAGFDLPASQVGTTGVWSRGDRRLPDNLRRGPAALEPAAGLIGYNWRPPGKLPAGRADPFAGDQRRVEGNRISADFPASDPAAVSSDRDSGRFRLPVSCGGD